MNATDLSDHYDDYLLDSGHPLRELAERAFRDAYQAAAAEAANWIEPDTDAIDAALQARRDARKRAQVEIDGLYRYRPDHPIEAAQTRGRHHALEFACQMWERDDANDAACLSALLVWSVKVAQWAAAAIDDELVSAPPRPDDDWQVRTKRASIGRHP